MDTEVDSCRRERWLSLRCPKFPFWLPSTNAMILFQPCASPGYLRL